MPKRKPFQKESLPERKLELKLIQVQQIKDLHKAGKSYRQIALEVLGNEKLKSKVYRWLNT